MIQMACECNDGIPGVDRLPPHDHNQARNYEDTLRLNADQRERIEEIAADHWPLRDTVHIWVNWREVARA